MSGGESLRIAVFSDSALPVLNGVSISIDALVQELRRQGHRKSWGAAPLRIRAAQPV